MPSQESNKPDNEQERKNYENVLANLRQISDVRFKLLTFLPLISGLGVGIISFNIEAFKAQPLPRFVAGVLGFIVTLGVVFYDRSNTQKEEYYQKNAKTFERDLNPNEDDNPPNRFDKQIAALALIYGSALGAWLFPIFCGLLWGVQHVNTLIEDPNKYHYDSSWQEWVKFWPEVPVLAGLFAMTGMAIAIVKLLRPRLPERTLPDSEK